ncbi:C-C motif chemokine 19, partial [Mesitornis unicolor]
PPPVNGHNYALDCCLKTRDTPIPWRRVQDYRLQQVQDGCDFPAVVFVTVKGRRICAPVVSPWVSRLQEKVDARKVR